MLRPDPAEREPISNVFLLHAVPLHESDRQQASGLDRMLTRYASLPANAWLGSRVREHRLVDGSIIYIKRNTVGTPEGPLKDLSHMSVSPSGEQLSFTIDSNGQLKSLSTLHTFRVAEPGRQAHPDATTVLADFSDTCFEENARFALPPDSIYLLTKDMKVIY